MSAKQSAETRHAIQLNKDGISVYESARLAGICPSTLYRALKLIHKNKCKKRLAKNSA